MERILERGLNKLKKQTSGRSRKDVELRDSIDRVVQAVLREQERRDDEMAGGKIEDRAPRENDETTAEARGDKDISGAKTYRGTADAYFEPFCIAMTRAAGSSSKLKVAALDTVEKLIAHGYLRGGGPWKPKVEESGATKTTTTTSGTTRVASSTIMDHVVVSICECGRRTAMSDSDVHLQIIKALLTAVSSSTCRVNRNSLLYAVQTCVDVYSKSRNEIIVTTTKACLTQMLHAVFQRMEVIGGLMREEEEEEEDATDGHAVETKTTASSSSATATATDADTKTTTDALAVGSSSSSHSPFFASDAHENAYLLFKLLCDMSMTATVSLSSSSSSTAAAAAASQHVVDGKGNDEDDGESIGEENGKNAARVAARRCEARITRYASPTHARNRKILSLDLVLSVLRDAGEEFERTGCIRRILKDDLCRAILQNSLAQETSIVDRSLKIFSILITNFKAHLVAQIEVFINTIFLRLLDSPNTTFEHKIGVLKVFYKICQDENAVVEIFLNYDAAFGPANVGRTDAEKAETSAAAADGDDDAGGIVNMMDGSSLMDGLFESIVSALERVAQGKGQRDMSKQTRTTAQELQLRKIALASLVAILDSLVKFTHDDDVRGPAGMYVEKREGGNAEEEEDDDDEDDEEKKEVRDADETDHANTDAATPSAAAAVAAVSSTPSSTDIRAGIDAKRRLQKELTVAFRLFKEKPKKGLKYLADRKLLRLDSARAVANFLTQYAEQLDKTMIGDYLGAEKPFNLEVLREYIERLRLEDLEYDEAIRLFLSGFRLPGEAQKIDRIMERFAARYLVCNPGRFANADTAFILGYAIIMLQTDLHNPNIKPEKKMTVDTFVRQNRGIDDGKDLPRPFLKGIYDRIKKNPFTLREDDLLREREEKKKKVSRGLFFDETRHKAKKFAEESEKMAQQSLNVLRQKVVGEKGGHYLLAEDHRDHVRPMFEIVWEPALAVFSVTMEMIFNGEKNVWITIPDDPRDDPEGRRDGEETKMVVDLCLRGVRHAIRLAGVEGMDEPLMSFVHCLCKFTGLHPQHTFRRKRMKEIACVKALLATALSEGDHLRDAWNPILAAVSQLSRLRKGAAGAWGTIKEGADGRDDGDTSGEDGAGGFGGFFASAETQARQRRAKQRRLVSAFVSEEVDMRSLDRIFVQSSRLSSKAIAHFVKALCDVSRRELEESAQVGGGRRGGSKHRRGVDGGRRQDRSKRRRVFSLQKVVEVADFNIACRGRMTWHRMWRELAEYFTQVGRHSSRQIAMYAVDSLKQLSMKFLEKSEMRGFNFQSSFLRPFESILETPEIDGQVKELVLCVMRNIVLARVRNIRSGWRSVFRVLKIGGRGGGGGANEDLVRLGFSVLHHVVRDDKVFAHCVEGAEGANHFKDLVDALVIYAGSDVVDGVAVVAIEHLRKCAGRLATKASVVGKKRETTDDDDGGGGGGGGRGRILHDTSEDRELLFPALNGLARLVTGPHLEVRLKAMRALFQTLRGFSGDAALDSALWRRIFRDVLFQTLTQIESLASGGDEDRRRESKTPTTQMSQRDRDSSRLCLNEIVKLFALRFDNLVVDDAAVAAADRGETNEEDAVGSEGAAKDEDDAKTSSSLLEILLLHLRSFVESRNLDLACVGVDGLKLLLLVAGERFDGVTWTRVSKELAYLFRECAPNALSETLRAYRTPQAKEAQRRAAANDDASSTSSGGVESSRHRRSSSSASARGPPPAPPPPAPPARSDVLVKGSKVHHRVFGSGTLLCDLDATGVTPRVKLDVSGAILYATSGIVSATHAELERATKDAIEDMFVRRRLPFDEALVFTRCKVQLELLPALSSVVDAHFDRLGFEHKLGVLDCLRYSADMAREFNRAKSFRELLFRLGFMKHLKLTKLTNLLRQEAAATQLSRTILFRMANECFDREKRCEDGTRAEVEVAVRQSSEVERRLRALFETTLAQYLELDDAVRSHLTSVGLLGGANGGGGSGGSVVATSRGEATGPGSGVAAAVRRVEEGRALTFFDRDAVQFVTGVSQFAPALFERYVGWFFPVVVKLIRARNLDLRQLVARVMERNVYPLVLKGACADGGM